MPPQNWSTFIELLRSRAAQDPDRRAYTFLVDGDTVEDNITYAELDRQARAIAATLQQTLASGDRALLMFPPGLGFISAFFGCLYSGVIAVPIPFPNPARLERALPRLRAIVRSATPKAVLTTAPNPDLVARLRAQTPELGDAVWVASDGVAAELAETWQEPHIQSDTLAFLQYTSGSTALPKGVMVSHGNLLSNLANLDAGFEHSAESVMVSWLPVFHDMGLIYGVLQPLYNGFLDVLMSPMAFLQQPGRWLKAISRYRGTHNAAPNFAFDLCVRLVTAEQRADLDLSSWRVVLNGAEPVRGETLRRFNEMFGPCGFNMRTFCPGYGLAEATLKVAITRVDVDPILLTVQTEPFEQNRIVEAAEDDTQAKTLVGCGPPELDIEIAIVDPQTLMRCAPDQIGEIWTRGSGKTHGYWQRPEETRETFEARIADTGEGPYLRTGDLGFLWQGGLFITGRLKDLIIIDGRNIYPQDIEETVERNVAAVRPSCCAAFSVDVDDQERLVIVAEVDRHYRAQKEGGAAAAREALVRAIRSAVTREHDVQPYRIELLKVGGVLKTSSGKIQRHACRAKFLAQTLELWGEDDDNRHF
jgi:acyl-CoA synthetase (AMP-forming)/AMP-acid ligase II